MGPKLAVNVLNRLQNHTEDKETHKQNKEQGIFYWIFFLFFSSCNGRFFPTKILIISLLTTCGFFLLCYCNAGQKRFLLFRNSASSESLWTYLCIFSQSSRDSHTLVIQEEYENLLFRLAEFWAQVGEVFSDRMRAKRFEPYSSVTYLNAKNQHIFAFGPIHSKK